LKPLPNDVLAIIIKINLTTNYQLLLNCNKVHRAQTTKRRTKQKKQNRYHNKRNTTCNKDKQ
jgi:hypothetical protein